METQTTQLPEGYYVYPPHPWENRIPIDEDGLGNLGQLRFTEPGMGAPTRLKRYDTIIFDRASGSCAVCRKNYQLSVERKSWVGKRAKAGQSTTVTSAFNFEAPPTAVRLLAAGAGLQIVLKSVDERFVQWRLV